MAIIHGRAPQPQAASVVTRIVVKLHEGVPPTAAGSDEAGALRRAAPELRFRSYLTDADRLLASRSAMFERYLVAEVPDRDAAQALARRLQPYRRSRKPMSRAGPRRRPPSIRRTTRAAPTRATSPRRPRNRRPVGLVVTDGDGVGFVDVEQGWTLNHEDLAGAENHAALRGQSGLSGPRHGRAWRGASPSTTRSATSGSRRARSGRVVSQYRTATTYDTAAAILSAAGAMSAGDVMLLEAQTTVAGSTYPAGRGRDRRCSMRSRHAVDLGIVVVEAGGNGVETISMPGRRRRKARLNRNSADFRDSGAIMVGAATRPPRTRRLSFSNSAAGSIATPGARRSTPRGDGWTGQPRRTPTRHGFGGTSGASPIIAGAALLLQSWRKRRSHAAYGPDTVRSLLSDPRTGTASANPADRPDRRHAQSARSHRAAGRRRGPLRVVNDRLSRNSIHPVRPASMTPRV